MKKFKFPLLRMLCIGTCLAAVSLAPVSAEKITKEFNGLTLMYDKEQKIVGIKTDRTYDESVEKDVQKLLHSYNEELEGGLSQCRLNLKVKKRVPRGYDVRVYKKFFNEKYGFSPNAIRFNGVDYVYRNRTLTISSDSPSAVISPGCVECFGLSPKIGLFRDQLYSLRDIIRDCGVDTSEIYIEKIVIKGMGFKEIPPYCFFGLKAESLDTTQSGIKYFDKGALYNCAYLKCINVNPNLINSFTIYGEEDNNNLELLGYNKVPTCFQYKPARLLQEKTFKYNGSKYSVKTLIPGVISGNIVNVLSQKIEAKCQKEEAIIDTTNGKTKKSVRKPVEDSECCIV